MNHEKSDDLGLSPPIGSHPLHNIGVESLICWPQTNSKHGDMEEVYIISATVRRSQWF